jgi:hypothetical protein
MKALSIHIGLNEVDPDAYDGWNGALAGCINDAKAMKAIAEKQGYQASMLIDKQATSANVIKAIANAAKSLKSGDYLLLTYSGHGGHVPDVNSDEDDSQDETWVLWDRMLIDDELYQLWSQFKKGVRIFMLSDSCHSGTVARVLLANKLKRAQAAATRSAAPDPDPKFRAIPDSVARAAYAASPEIYDTAQYVAGPSERAMVGASVILISGCQDNQLSADGAGNGLFTEKLLQIWNKGAFRKSHRALHQEIVKLMPNDQTPNYFTTGVADKPFEDQRPFSPGTAAQVSAPLNPSITGPQSIDRSAGPPTFDVVTGSNPYYIVEITSRPELFDYVSNGSERSPSNFYATWNDSAAPSRLTSPTFTLSEEAWEELRDADRLYYRIGTTSSSTAWDDYMLSTGDADGASGPSLEITSASVSPQPPSGPRVTGPASVPASGGPPSFNVVTGVNAFYIFEITSRPELFDGARSGERKPGNFYASWADPAAPRRYTSASYTLPAAAWSNLKAAGRLYFRIGTSATATSWDNYAVSTLDNQGASAPSLSVSREAEAGAGAPPPVILTDPGTPAAPPPSS